MQVVLETEVPGNKYARHLCPANERRRYKVTPSLISWAQSVVWKYKPAHTVRMWLRNVFEGVHRGFLAKPMPHRFPRNDLSIVIRTFGFSRWGSMFWGNVVARLSVIDGFGIMFRVHIWNLLLGVAQQRFFIDLTGRSWNTALVIHTVFCSSYLCLYTHCSLLSGQNGQTWLAAEMENTV